MNSSIPLPVLKISGEMSFSVADLLAVEEPLEIRLAYFSPKGAVVQNLAVTMRTPGQDADLALGFLYTEGIISHPSEVEHIEHVAIACSENRQNVIQVSLREGVVPKLDKADRNFYTTSSCGVCGKASIDAIRTIRSDGKAFAAVLLDPALILGLPESLVSVQRVFADTGGLHAAALFNEAGELILVREDVGRHNALDKLIGAALGGTETESHGVSKAIFDRSILLLSGRASFELVQKAAMAGIPVIAAVGAPSSLAVSLAEEFGITLIGFLRRDRFNIYSAIHRIVK